MTNNQGNFTVYRSSAGSGKTYTLVKQYLGIALADPRRFRNILAITFTNKAAAEMKKRVLQYLSDLSAPDSPANKTQQTLLPELCRSTGLDAREIRQRSAEILSLILHNYSDFAITTIDALMHKVIRTFTFDLRLSAAFEVELDRNRILRDAIGVLISRAGTDPGLTRVLLTFIKEKASDDKNLNIEKDILELSQKTWELEGTEAHLEKLSVLEIEDLLAIADQLNEHNKNFENDIRKRAAAARDLLQQAGIDNADLYQGKKGIGNWFQKLAEGGEIAFPPNSFVNSTLDEDKWVAGKCSADKRARIEAYMSALGEAGRELRTAIALTYPRYQLYRLILKTFYPLILLNEVRKIMTEIKQRDNLVLISDFNLLISRVVESESVPFIYERLGVRYRNFMIDEFQDTSLLQWRNLIPLLENMLADGNYCMLVGDGKQAIYRWRNGEVAQFVALPQIYNRPDTTDYRVREEALARNYHEEQLAVNYRSSKVVVEFNNDLYDVVADGLDPEQRKIFEGQRQDTNPAKTGGYVEIHFFEDGKDVSASGERLSELINVIRADGYQLHDIALLCRSNRLASALAGYLMNKGIPVVSAESLLLNNNPLVEFLLAAHRYLLHPGDAISRASMVRYLHLKGQLGEQPLHESLVKSASLTAFRELLLQHNIRLHASQLLKMAMYDRFEEIARCVLTGQEADPYLQFFLDFVREYSKNSGKQEDDFEHWWEEKKDNATIIIPEGMDAINVMTIHRSKGLEFPVVISPGDIRDTGNTLGHSWTDFSDPDVPGLPSLLLPNNKNLQDTPFGHLYDNERSKSMLDFANLMYVATTRAAQRLYLQLSMPPENIEQIKSIESAVAALLKKKEMYRSGQTFYSFGKADKHTAEPRTVSGETLSTMISAPWQNRAVLSLEHPQHTSTDGTAEKRNWGNLLHMVLSRLISLQDIPAVLDQLSIGGLIPRNELEKLELQLQRMLQHPELAALLNTPGEVRTEATLLDADGQSYRPDRVTISDKRVTLTDYKTGKPNEKHSDQLRKYAALLTEMGYSIERSALVYLEENAINIINC